MIVIRGEIHSSKNSRRILVNKRTHKPFVAKSKSSKDDEHSFAYQLNLQAAEWEQMVADQFYPYTICFKFIRATKRRFDYINMAQGILDAMVKSGYIEDDDADHVLPMFVPYEVDKNNAGCEITV